MTLEIRYHQLEGFKSFKETSISIPMWNFNQREHDYFDSIVGNIDTHYKDYNVTSNKYCHTNLKKIILHQKL